MGTLKHENFKNIITGIFFTSFSIALVEFFLPFFLKEQGLSALQIGGLFTLGIAIGSLVFSISFAKILRKIKLKTGLVLAGLFGFIKTFLLYLLPTIGGSLGNKVLEEVYKPISRISIDSTIQHNVEKNKERKTSIAWLILDGTGLILGIILSMILIPVIGFRNSFLIFALISLPGIFFYLRVDDKTRFKPQNKKRLSPFSGKLKLLLLSEILYWLALASSFALVITFLVSEKLSGGVFDLGILFIALYVSMNLTGYLTKEKLNEIREIRTAIFGMSLLLLSAILIILSRNFYVILLAFVLEGIGAGIWVPSKTALQWKNTKKQNRERVSGWLSGWRGFVAAFGPLIGGFLITKVGINAPFYFKAGISIISLSIYLYVARKS